MPQRVDATRLPRAFLSIFLFPSDRSVSVYRSASAFPSDLFKLSVFNDDRDGQVPVRYRKHLFAKARIILRVAIIKSNAPPRIMLARLLAVRTARLCVNYNVQFEFPFGVCIKLTAAFAASVADRHKGCKDWPRLDRLKIALFDVIFCGNLIEEMSYDG